MSATAAARRLGGAVRVCRCGTLCRWCLDAALGPVPHTKHTICTAVAAGFR